MPRVSTGSWKRPRFEPSPGSIARTIGAWLSSTLKTISEAIDYINIRLTEAQQAHELVRAARERLYYAAETGIQADAAHAREALERALRALKIGG